MTKIARYPLTADATPMDLLVGVLVDAAGNSGARLTNPPLGPDGSPIDVVGLVMVDSNGSIVTPGSDENIRDVIAAALVAGANITITVDDPGNTITIAAVTDPEVVRDTIGAALVAGTNIAITPNDAGDTITIAFTGTTTTDVEVVRDTIGAALVAGTNVTITVNDAADTITIAATTDPEVVRDTIGATLVAGANITITVNDAGDTITIAANAAADSWQYVKLTADYTGATATLEATGLTVAGGAFAINSYYEFEAMLSSKVSGGGHNLALVWPTANVTGVAAVRQINGSGETLIGGDQSTTLQTSNLNNAGFEPVIVKGFFFTGGTAPTGSLAIQIKNAAGTATHTVGKGSFLKYRQLP